MSAAGGGITRVVGAAVLDSAAHPTRVLAAQRAYPESLRGLWEFPGGKQEPGEDPGTALRRECREELGVDVHLLREVVPPEPAGWPLAGAAVMRVFTAVLDESSAAAGAAAPSSLADRVRGGDDHLDARWLPLDDPHAVLALPWIPADLPIVTALLAMMRPEGV